MAKAKRAKTTRKTSGSRNNTRTRKKKNNCLLYTSDAADD